MTRLMSVAAIVVLAGCSSIPAVSSSAGEDLKALASNYVQAQFSFDQKRVRNLTAPAFVEISPKGEVDERDKVISFYAPDKRTDAPDYTISDARVRTTDRMAVVTQVVTIGKSPRAISLSQAITAARVGGVWKITSSQSTPIPANDPGK